MRKAFITGANKGIGFEVAKILGQKGIHVLLGARDADRGKAALAQLHNLKISAEFIPIDIASESSVLKAIENIEVNHDSIDILINNAGIFPEFSAGIFDISELSVETLQNTFNTNLFGAIRVTKYMLPLLRKAEYANIVNVSSTAGSITDQSDPNSPFYGIKALAYTSSKAALNMMTVQLAKQLEGTSVKINSICPGWVRTDMGSDAAPKSVSEGASIIVSTANLSKDDQTNGVFIDEQGSIPW